MRATFSWQDGEEMQSVTRTVPTIEQAWGESGIMLYENPALHAQLHASLWSQGMDGEFLESVENAKGIHPYLDEAEDTVECLTVAQRKQFLETVLSHPKLLDPLQIKQAVDVYRSFRMGTPEEALDVFGLWAQRHADYESRMPDHSSFYGFDYHNRKAYRLMAICVAKQLPEHSDRLRDEYLELEDGGCSLPVAYILAFSYLGRDRFEEWTELLDSKLAEETLTGDRRANWLLARAMAHEMRLGQRTLYGNPWPRAMNGRGWIDEGLIFAETDAIRERLVKELAGRLVSVGRYDQARELINEKAPNAIAAPVWRDAIDRFETDVVKEQEAEEAVAKQAYIDRLKERRSRAATQGDDAATARYDALIDANTSE